MASYSPEHLKILKNLGLVKDEPTQVNSTTPPNETEIADLKAKGFDTRAFENPELGLTDSNLGILANSLSKGVGDSMPKNIATGIKTIAPASFAPAIDSYIDKQNAEMAQSDAELTTRARESTFKKVADIGGEAAGILIPAAVGAGVGVLAAPASIAAGTAGMIGGLGAATGVGAASTGAEFFDRRVKELEDKGFTTEDARKTANSELSTVVGKEVINQGATNVASALVGGVIGKGAIGGLQAFGRAAALDAPLGGASGVISELNVGASLDGGVDKDMMKDKAVLGALVGGGLSGAAAVPGGLANKSAISSAKSKLAAKPSALEVEVQRPLNNQIADERAEFLNSTVKEPGVRFEARPFVNDKGETSPNQKSIFAIRDAITNEDGTVAPKTEESTVAENTTSIQEPLVNQEQTPNNTLEEVVNTNPEDINKHLDEQTIQDRDNNVEAKDLSYPKIDVVDEDSAVKQAALKEYISINDEKKSFSRSSTEFGSQITVKQNSKGDNFAAAASTLRGWNKLIDQQAVEVKNLDGSVRKNKFDMTSLQNGDKLNLNPILSNVNGKRTKEVQILAPDNKTVIGKVADEIASHIYDQMVIGNYNKVDAVYFKELVPRSKGADDKINIDGKWYRQTVNFVGKVDDINVFTKDVGTENTNSSYQYKKPSKYQTTYDKVTEAIAKNDAEGAQKIFDEAHPNVKERYNSVEGLLENFPKYKAAKELEAASATKVEPTVKKMISTLSIKDHEILNHVENIRKGSEYDLEKYVEKNIDNPKFLNDKNILNEIIKRDAGYTHLFPDNIKNDPQFIIDTIDSLHSLTDDTKNIDKYIMEQINFNKDIVNNKDFWIEVSRVHDTVYSEYIPSSLKNSPDFIRDYMEAFARNPRHLDYIYESISSDKLRSSYGDTYKDFLETFEKYESAKNLNKDLESELKVNPEVKVSDTPQAKPKKFKLMAVRDIKSFMTKNLNDTKIREDFVAAFGELSDEISALNKSGVNQKVKLIIDSEVLNKELTPREKRVVAAIKKANGDGPGTLYHNPNTGERFGYLNLDNIVNTAIDNNLNISDFAKFVYTHEVIGHGGISTFFKTVDEYNAYMDNIYETSSDGVKFLIENKRSLYESHGKKDIDLNREITEEILADLANGQVSFLDNDGTIKIKSIDDFSKDYAASQFTDKSYATVVREFFDFVKTAINKLVGNDVFKVYKDTKDNLDTLALEVKEMSKTLQLNSPIAKARQDFIKTASPEQFKLMAAVANDPRHMVNGWKNDLDKKMYGWLSTKGEGTQKTLGWTYEAATGLLGTGVKNVATQWNRRMTNPKFKYVFDMITGIKQTGNAVDMHLQGILRGLYEAGMLGTYKDGPKALEIQKVSKAIFETLIKNDKLTEAEMKKLGMSDREMHYYDVLLKHNQESTLLQVKSEIYYQAHMLGLKSDEAYNKYGNITDTNLPFDTYVQSIVKDMPNPDSAAKLQAFITKQTDDKINSAYQYEIFPSGKYYLYEEGADGKVIRFEQFDSEKSAKRAKGIAMAKNPDAKIGIDQTPSEIADVNNPMSTFNIMAKKFIANKVEDYRANPDAEAPINFFQNLIATSNDVSKTASLNIHKPNIDAAIQGLKDTNESKLAQDLIKARDQELKPDEGFVSGARYINSLWNLGFSIASSINNMLGMFTITYPYFSQFEGGTAALWSAKKVLTDGDLIWKNKKLSKEKMTNIILERYIEPEYRDRARADVERLIDSGVLKETGDYNLLKTKDGVDITSKTNRAFDAFNHVFMYPFSKSESVNRLATGVAALNIAYKTGKDGFDFARESIYTTQGYYGKAGRPAWARNPLGQLVYQFKTYPMNFTEFMVRSVFVDKNPAVAAKMATALVLMGGLGALPMVDDINDLVNTIRRIFGDEDANLQKEVNSALDKVVGDDVAKWLHNGVVSKAMPWVKPRSSMADIVPGSNLFDPANNNRAKSVQQIFGPTGSNLSNIREGVTDIANGVINQNGKKVVSGIRKAAPTTVNNMIQGAEAAATGDFNDKNGKKLANADSGDAVLKFFGFQPKTLVEANEAISKLTMDAQNLTYIKRAVTDLYAEAIIDKNPEKRQIAKSIFDKYNLENPTAKMKINKNSIKQRVKEANMNQNQRFRSKLSKELRPEFDNEVKE
jgi:hypothetical protein